MQSVLFKIVFVTIVGLMLWLFKKYVSNKTFGQLVIGDWVNKGDNESVLIHFNEDWSFTYATVNLKNDTTYSCKGKYHMTGDWINQNKKGPSSVILKSNTREIILNNWIKKIDEGEMVLSNKKINEDYTYTKVK